MSVSQLISAAQAAAYLGVKINTLAVWRLNKRYPSLKYRKIGRLIRYELDSVLSFNLADEAAA